MALPGAGTHMSGPSARRNGGDVVNAKVLVAYATKYGSTRGVAERIGARLTDQGYDVMVAPAGNATGVDGFSAVIVGSPLYIGNLLRPAATFLQRHATELNRMPTAVFALGPMRASDGFEGPREELTAALQKAGVRPKATEVFVGSYDPDKLRGMDRLVRWMPVSPLKGAGAIDERDWDAIDAWAESLPALLGIESLAAVR